MTAPTATRTSETPAPFKRKKLFVDGFLQGRVLRHVLLYWTAYHLFLWNAMFLYRYLQYRGALLAGARPQSFVELFRQFTLENYSIIVCAVAILPLVLWDILVVTHKVSGPLVRFQRALKQMARGEHIAPITLRKGDLLVGLQDSFNDYLASLDPSSGRNQDAATRPTPSESARETWVFTPEDGQRLIEELRQMQSDLWKTCDTPRKPGVAVRRG